MMYFLLCVRTSVLHGSEQWHYPHESDLYIVSMNMMHSLCTNLCPVWQWKVTLPTWIWPTYMYVCVRVCMYMYVYMYMCMYIRICMYMCVCVCLHICICTVNEYDANLCVRTSVLHGSEQWHYPYESDLYTFIVVNEYDVFLCVWTSVLCDSEKWYHPQCQDLTELLRIGKLYYKLCQ